MGTETKCKFCLISSGESNAKIVYADDFCLGFLDIRPVFPGHVLVIPRKHYVTLPDLPNDLVLPLFKAVRTLSEAVPKAMEAEGTFVGINNKISQSVPHLHVHVVPRRRGDGLRGFFWPRQKYPNEAAMEEVARKIREAVDAIVN